MLVGSRGGGLGLRQPLQAVQDPPHLAELAILSPGLIHVRPQAIRAATVLTQHLVGKVAGRMRSDSLACRSQPDVVRMKPCFNHSCKSWSNAAAMPSSGMRPLQLRAVAGHLLLHAIPPVLVVPNLGELPLGAAGEGERRVDGPGGGEIGGPRLRSSGLQEPRGREALELWPRPRRAPRCAARRSGLPPPQLHRRRRASWRGRAAARSLP